MPRPSLYAYRWDGRAIGQILDVFPVIADELCELIARRVLTPDRAESVANECLRQLAFEFSRELTRNGYLAPEVKKYLHDSQQWRQFSKRLTVACVPAPLPISALKSHRDGLDCMASLIRDGTSDPAYRITASQRKQIEAKFRELALAGFETAEGEVDEIPDNVLLQIHTLRSSIQVKIEILEASHHQNGDSHEVAASPAFETAQQLHEALTRAEMGAPLDAVTCSRGDLVNALKNTPGYVHKQFARFAEVTEDQYKEWRQRDAKKWDRKIRDAATRWLNRISQPT